MLKFHRKSKETPYKGEGSPDPKVKYKGGGGNQKESMMTPPKWELGFPRLPARSGCYIVENQKKRLHGGKKKGSGKGVLSKKGRGAPANSPRQVQIQGQKKMGDSYRVEKEVRETIGRGNKQKHKEKNIKDGACAQKEQCGKKKGPQSLR